MQAFKFLILFWGIIENSMNFTFCNIKTIYCSFQLFAYFLYHSCGGKEVRFCIVNLIEDKIYLFHHLSLIKSWGCGWAIFIIVCPPFCHISEIKFFLELFFMLNLFGFFSVIVVLHFDEIFLLIVCINN